MLDLEMSVLIEVKKSVEFVPWGDVRVLALRLIRVRRVGTILFEWSCMWNE